MSVRIMNTRDKSKLENLYLYTVTCIYKSLKYLCGGTILGEDDQGSREKGGVIVRGVIVRGVIVRGVIVRSNRET